MKRTFLILLIIGTSVSMSVAQEIIKSTYSQLLSPDGKYQFTFYQKQVSTEAKQMYYTLAYDGKTVIEESTLGVLIDNKLFESALGIPNDNHKQWGDNLFLSKSEKKGVNQTWKPLYGERSTVADNYNELILKFQKGDDVQSVNSEDGYDKRRYYMMNLEIRAYNQGVAFRYHFPEANNGLFIHILGEQTQFTLPEETMAYYESWAQGPYSLQPLKNWTDESERPLTMKLKNGLTVALLEAGMVDYARMKFRLDEMKANTLQASLYSSVDIITPYNTPWRVVMAADKAIDLIANNDIVLNLNSNNQIKDTSWIKPGKIMRSSQLDQKSVLSVIDFAAERNLQYVHLDAGWYGPEISILSDATTVSENRDLEIQALINYAKTKGIGIWVYVNQRALYNQLDEILPLYKKWGIKGIKFGFVQIGNQKWTTWLHDAIKKCAQYEIMVDIHDEYRPTGFSRTYPNLLTQEGIRGNEEFPDATHNTILPFTRFLAGAGDYTICYYDKRIKTTHAHQLAMAAVYYSPLQFLYWYDIPSRYEGEPEIDFFDKIPTVWDDTKPIAGDIGEFVTIVRRSGDDWFLGTLGNNEARKISTSLSFLNANQKYVAHIYTDDETVETKTKVKVTQIIVDNTSILDFQLKPSGGCAIHFTPASKEDLKKNKTYRKNFKL